MNGALRYGLAALVALSTAAGKAMDGLGVSGAKVQPIFITVDPERDTPEGSEYLMDHSAIT